MLQIKNAAYGVLLSARVQNVITFDDVKRICRENGWELYSYKQADRFIEIVGASKMKRYKAFSWHHEGHTFIFYRDGLSIRTKTLCICHEIGHIALGHMPGKPYTVIGDVQEIEANIFAYEMVCPTIVLRRCGPWTNQELCNACPITPEGAAYYIAELRKQIPAYNITYDQILDQYEDMIVHIKRSRLGRSARTICVLPALIAALLLLMRLL